MTRLILESRGDSPGQPASAARRDSASELSDVELRAVGFPRLTGIDHVHVYVSSHKSAEAWYGDVLGLRRVEALMSWAADGGPLTLENPAGSIHLALFERSDHPGSTAIAFGAKGDDFLAWKTHLEGKGLQLRITDHKLAYSLYFTDPDNNLHEITTYERDLVAGCLDEGR